MIGLALGGIALVGIAGFAALQYAVARNGPAVLDAVDRIAGQNGSAVESLAPVAYGDHPNQKLYIHRIQAQGADTSPPVLIFMHGGSWADGDPADYTFVARNLAPSGFLVVNTGYRLGDDGKFPAMLEDAAASLRWVRDNIADYGGDPDQIYLMGHSAGAYNAVMLALDEQWLAAEDMDSSAIAGVIGLAGPYDFLPLTNENAKRAFGSVDPIESTQPINFARTGAPPMLLLQGEADTTVGPHNTRNMAAALNELGGTVETEFYTELDHAGILTALANPWRQRRQVIDRILEFTAAQHNSNDKASVSVQGKTR